MRVESRGSRVESQKDLAAGLAPPVRRTGISLTEVLIAMGILTVGLLAVAALFPVGSFLMHKADISDRGSAIAQAVMNDIMARGMLNPKTWRVMIPMAANGPTLPSDAKYRPPTLPPNSYLGTYTRPLGDTLAEGLAQPTWISNRAMVVQQFGSAFVLDPLGVAAMAFPNNQTGPQAWNAVSSGFPASAYGTNFRSYSAGWQPWGQVWPVRRVTFQSPTTEWQMDAQTADHYFRGSDDLATDLPDRDDRPASQNWETVAGPNGTTTPLARQWAGDYTWVVTVVPTTSAALEGMGTNPEGFAYDVSVVVFYKRVLPEAAMNTYAIVAADNGKISDFANTMGDQERAVRAKVLSTGLNGGELLLTDLDDNPNKSPFDGLRTGQWIMLCGPHPNSNVVATGPQTTVGEAKFVLNWYQVLSVDTEASADLTIPAKQRIVALRGPQWPWQPSPPGSYSSAIADNLCVAVCRGAVAVHTKTLRLEGSGGSFAITNPTTTQPPTNVAH